jgi:hypothetical protein
MMKFFRKYTKELLVVFLVLLMVVFLGGSALESLMQPNYDSRVVFESALGDITFGDQKRAQNMQGLLGAMGIDWSRPMGELGVQPLEVTDWILLVREAEKNGLQADPAFIRAELTQLEMMDAINAVAHRARRKTDDVLYAYATHSSVVNLVEMVGLSAMPSELEVRKAAHDALDKVTIQAVSLPASAFAPDPETANFTEAELQTHFEAYRDRYAGEGINFGYHVPHRVRVRYIRFDPSVVAEELRDPPRLIEREAERYYQENRASEPRFLKDVPALMEDPTTGEETESAETEKAPMTWEEAKEEAIKIVRQQRAQDVVDRMANWVVQYDANAWLGVQRDEKGFRPAPEGVDNPDHYRLLLERMPANIAYPNAMSFGSTPLFSANDLAQAGEIGRAKYTPETLTAGQGTQDLSQIAFRVEGVLEKLESSVDFATALSLYETSAFVLEDAAQNRYVFSVVEVDQPHPAKSLDEVRDQVIRDLCTLRGYEAAEAHAKRLAGKVADAPLREVFEADEPLLPYTKPEEGAPEVVFMEPAPFARVMHWIVLAQPEPPWTTISGLGRVSTTVAEQCFALEQKDPPVGVVPLQERGQVLLVKWLQTQRGTLPQFTRDRGSLMSSLSQARQREVLQDWLSPERIRERYDVQVAE